MGSDEKDKRENKKSGIIFLVLRLVLFLGVKSLSVKTGVFVD